MAREKMDYKKMSLESMLDWIEKNKSLKEQIKFAEVGFAKNTEGKRIKHTREAKQYFMKEYEGEVEFINAPKPRVKKKDIVARMLELLGEDA